MQGRSEPYFFFTKKKPAPAGEEDGRTSPAFMDPFSGADREYRRPLGIVDPGYSPLHLAAGWGHLETVRTLLEFGADTQVETFRGEGPLDLAWRYSWTDCADCLSLAAPLKLNRESYVAFVKDLTSHPQRGLTKEEKACSAKSDWIQSVEHATESDFIAQRRELQDAVLCTTGGASTKQEPSHSRVGAFRCNYVVHKFRGFRGYL
ncbi:ankyrin repeat domain-containing protein 45 [Gymnodraco acuticeps]|uniref:Ankyrin repeat domain-containing protein 45 n=1 Tax=Gymnodraco acuticeps TaxID=8218 RepID=A0A6P8UTQ8_GYMAC|nr:ankyrin repeat domain-containing protein 45 [Gymnodraco acuticeps]